MTERQQQVLQAIVEYRAKHGFSPTIRELGRLLHITSPNGMMFHLRRLRQLNKITWNAKCSRSIVPVTDDAVVSVPLATSHLKKLRRSAQVSGVSLEEYCRTLLEAAPAK